MTMNLDLLQHAIVTAIALLAAWVVLRRVVGVFRPASGTTQACPSCASGQVGCVHTSRRAPAPPPAAAVPLTLHRPTKAPRPGRDAQGR